MSFLLRTHNHRKMARLAVSIAVIFFLFALCHASFPFDASEKEVTGAERVSITTLPKPDAKTPITILLPSEKPESEPATLVELEPEDAQSKLPESDGSGSDTVSIALRTIDFRPINRHFPRHLLPLTFHRSHGCRHQLRRHHHHDQEHHIVEFKQLGERFPDREVSYGDDMIVSNEVSDSDQVVGGVVRQIPAKWAKFGHEESRFNQEDADVEGTEDMMKKRHHQHEEREEREREHHDHDEDHDDNEEHEHKGSLRMWAKIGHEGPRFHHEDADVEGTEHMKKRHHEDREEKEREHDDDDEAHEHKHKHKGWLRKWDRFGHEGPRFHHGYADEEGREHMKKWHHGQAEREHDHDKHGREDNGWMKSIRKFLGQF